MKQNIFLFILLITYNLQGTKKGVSSKCGNISENHFTPLNEPKLLLNLGA